MHFGIAVSPYQGRLTWLQVGLTDFKKHLT